MYLCVYMCIHIHIHIGALPEQQHEAAGCLPGDEGLHPERSALAEGDLICIYVYIYIYIHTLYTHTHTYIHIYLYTHNT